MKKLNLFLFLSLLFITYNLKAQLDFGLQFGLNSSSVSQTLANNVLTDGFLPPKSKLSLNVGLIVEYPLNEKMGLQSGLIYSQKGYQVDWDAFLKREGMSGSVDGYWKYNYNYLEIPFQFYYNLNSFVINVGPYLAYGLGGTSVVDATYKSQDESGSISDSTTLTAVTGEINADDFYQDDEDVSFYKAYKAFDAGFNVGIGYKYEQFMLKAQYGFGLINLTPGIKDLEGFNPDDYKMTNRVFNISLVYYFKK